MPPGGGDLQGALGGPMLKARAALGAGRYDDAVQGFESARDQCLDLDRSYDAVLTSLYLADALLAADRTEELRELALSLVPMFQSRGVARETLAGASWPKPAVRRRSPPRSSPGSGTASAPPRRPEQPRCGSAA